MAIIRLITQIHAPIERVFDLSRSIDAHRESTKNTSEKAVGGVTSGLIGLNQEVTWEARHLGVRQELTVRILQFQRPFHFQDVMTHGAFERMKHDHRFYSQGTVTVMEDVFEFRAPFGILGRIVELTFLTRYMKHFLIKRNFALKTMAESDEWKKFLSQ